MRHAIRVVLDTNIIASALLFSGQTSRAQAAWVEGRLTLLFSNEVLVEYRKVLGYSRSSLTEDEVTFLIEEEILPFGEVLKVGTTERSWIPEDPSDDKFIALAAAASADFLVSGDAHILAHKAELPCAQLRLPELLARISS